MSKRCRGPVNRLLLMRKKNLVGPGFQKISGNACVKTVGNFYDEGGAGAFGLRSAVIVDGDPSDIVLTFTGDLTATTAACGWTYSVNGGVDTAPTAAIVDNVLTLTTVAPIVCSDTVTVSYDPTGCDLNIDGEAIEAITDQAVSNGVASPIPVITAQPSNQEVTEPTAATFTITATGATSYQWYLNGSAISGETSNSYTTPATEYPQSGNYTCRAYNDCGSVLSDVATLTVNEATVGMTVKDSDGNEFTVPLVVKNSSGTEFTVTNTVRSSAGTGFEVI